MSHRRGPWSQAEDAYLMQLVHTQGALNWVKIAQTLGSRTPKQCRERYHQNLKPTLNHDPITPEEGLQIERLVHEIGKRWAEIARRLHGRSDNAVKNWWNGSQNRRKRMDRRKNNHTSQHYPDRQDTNYSRPTVTLSRPIAHELRTMPSPQSPPYWRQTSYQIEAPLPSPSVSEYPSGDAADSAPSLMSDCGSSYATSPRGHSSGPCSPVELPPLKAIDNRISRNSLLPTDAKLPGLSSLASPPYEQEKPRLPPILPPPDGRIANTHLPTAPNSPVTFANLRLPQLNPQAADKDARMNLSALLG